MGNDKKPDCCCGHCVACLTDETGNLQIEIYSLRQQLEEVREEKLKIIRGEFGQICSYCGEGNDDGLSWEELQEHIRACEKHPLYQANKKLQEQTKGIEDATKCIDNLVVTQELVLKRAEQAEAKVKKLEEEKRSLSLWAVGEFENRNTQWAERTDKAKAEVKELEDKLEIEQGINNQTGKLIDDAEATAQRLTEALEKVGGNSCRSHACGVIAEQALKEK